MKRRYKKIAIVSAAVALLAVGISMTAYAASGWQEENGVWVYLDRDGNHVANTWKKSGGQYYYLDGSGEMSVNALIEHDRYLYYVGEDGVQARNEWVCIANDAGDEEADDIWYYFGAAGRAYTGGKKTIGEKKYIFDDEGRMLTGWQQYGDNGDWYYLGAEDEGWARAGWQRLEPDEEMDGDYDFEEWFFFKTSTGAAYKDHKKYINGRRYTFDENGVMQDKWLVVASATPGGAGVAASPPQAYYHDGEGSQGKGWVYTHAPDDADGNEDKEWYYLDKHGVPFNENGKDSDWEGRYGMAYKRRGERWDYENMLKNVAARVINGRTYLFDSNGKMLTGCYFLNTVACTGSSEALGATRIKMEDGTVYYTGSPYYFCEEEGPKEGRMMTGKQTIVMDGTAYYFYFDKDGKAYVNIIADGALYGPDGARVNAEDEDYREVLVSSGSEVHEKGSRKTHTGCTMFVNRNGRVKKSGTVKYEGIKYTIKDYEVISEEEID